MSEPRRIQSVQGAGQQFNAFLANFQQIQSYTIANLLMLWMTSQMIQLSQIQQAVKLTESLVSGSVLGLYAETVASKLSSQLDNIYQGNASQLTMTMLHGQPFSNSPAVLKKAGSKLDERLSQLNAANWEKILVAKKSSGPDQPAPDDRTDYSGPKQGKR